MQLTLHADGAALTVTSCDEAGIRVGEDLHTQTIVLLADQVLRWRDITSVRQLTAELIGELTTHAPEIVILGTGETQTFPDPHLIALLMKQGIGCEVMTTPAACRTHNILVSEGRRAISVLLQSTQ